MSSKPSCFVVSNCTHAPIRNYLSATGFFSIVDSVAIFNVPKVKLDETAEVAKGYDYVFSLVLYDDWGPFGTNVLRQEIPDKIVTIATPFFNGLHPDLIHIKIDGRRVASPIGDYHSGLIYWGYMTGVSLRDLREMYEDAYLPPVFQAESVWSSALESIAQRDAHAEISTSHIYDEICRRKAAMLTFNHPSIDIIAELCKPFCEMSVGRKVDERIDHGAVFNPLTTDVTVPVSPAAARLYQLPYRTLPQFKCGLQSERPRQYISFEEFAQLSYDFYSQHPREALVPSTPAGLSKRLKDEIFGKAAK